MKRIVAGLVVVGLVAMVTVGMPATADAGGRYRSGGYSGGYSKGGGYWGAFGVGAVTGLVVGSVFAPRFIAAPPPVFYQPAPVYVVPAPVFQPAPVYVAPVCATQWVNTYWNGYSWTPGHWVQYCR